MEWVAKPSVRCAAMRGSSTGDPDARDTIGWATMARETGTLNDIHGTDAIGGMTSRTITSTHAKCATDGFRRVRPITHASAASGRASSAFPSAYSRTVRVMDSSRRGVRAGGAVQCGSGASGR